MSVFFVSIFIKYSQNFLKKSLYISLFSDVSRSVNSTVALSNPKLFFKCDVGGNISDDVVTFKYEKLKVQAFNVEDEKFAENGNFFLIYSYFIRTFFLCLLCLF